MSICSPKPNETNTLSSPIAVTQNGKSPPRGNINLNSYPSADTTYDEILQNPELFMEKLNALHRSVGTKFRSPILGGKSLNLHQLFVETTCRGGIEKAIEDRKWKEVVSSFNFPPSITSGSFALRKYYLSILYSFEQVYYHNKQLPPRPLIEYYSPATGHATALTIHDGGTGSSDVNDIPLTVTLPSGSSVFGTIDAKFENGYLITVNFGSQKLKGVLYHTPDAVPNAEHVSSGSTLVPLPIPTPPTTIGRRKKRKKNQSDPSLPKPKKSGYNFFFSEQYNALKASYRGQERAMTRKIGLMWNKLTDSEKQVYQEKGKVDKERFKSEMNFYKSVTNNKEQEEEAVPPQ
ncbi:high mobility group B protein 10-like [Impatiens glandulifera]|uniref:high mobility group B protein 10-like n=1 Tax=Impatiens glandulifera TaxID=253017 RepID=UPI001FB0EA26|nr:high mobility group B protein 10-like [Impatiens glandulifera]